MFGAGSNNKRFDPMTALKFKNSCLPLIFVQLAFPLVPLPSVPFHFSCSIFPGLYALQYSLVFCVFCPLVFSQEKREKEHKTQKSSGHTSWIARSAVTQQVRALAASGPSGAAFFSACVVCLGATRRVLWMGWGWAEGRRHNPPQSTFPQERWAPGQNQHPQVKSWVVWGWGLPLSLLRAVFSCCWQQGPPVGR